MNVQRRFGNYRRDYYAMLYELEVKLEKKIDKKKISLNLSRHTFKKIKSHRKHRFYFQAMLVNHNTLRTSLI